MRTVATFSRGVARIPHLPALLGADAVALRPRGPDGIDLVVGWGNKANTAAAQAFAARHGLRYWRAEDGFLRSVGIGASGEPPLSVVLDDLGIYYDARTESRLERLILDGDGDLARARRAIDRIVSAGLSKYNNAPSGGAGLGAREPGRARVLVVDQTYGDLSVEYGLADAGSFAAMLAAAQAENPGAEIIVKTHPDVVAGKKRGYLERPAGVRVLSSLVNPMALLAEVDRVYVVTSQLGFEALMAGKPVTTFGVPFYAGWGLTEDRGAVPARRGPTRSLEQVFAAAYLLYPRYVDPDTGRPGQLEDVIEHLALQRREFARNEGRIFCLGFRFWKHGYVRRYLRAPGNDIQFARDAEHAESLGFDAGSRLVVWGQRAGDDVRRLADRHGVRVERMEDGFLRSVGLGSDLATPASLVVDRLGIYFDPTRPSELEAILEAGGFTADELARARTLRERIVKTGLSKYNVGDGARVDVSAARGRRVILVPGQVEDDASIQLGCRSINTNLGLIEAARAAHPDGYILYKPHPDVLSGNRVGAVRNPPADHVETGASLADCLAVADEVHTLTSLVGFEALLRGLPVTVYGQPFYAGWGLTKDLHPVDRRTRRLGLDELVAGTLLRYPRYLNRTTGTFTTPEVVIEQLRQERDANPGARALSMSWPRRQLRKLVLATKGVFDAP